LSNSNNVIIQYVVFRLGINIYAVDIGFMEEVIDLDEIVELPDVPNHVKGVTKYRASVIPILSINQKLGLSGIEYSRSTRIIVVTYREEKIGILVDELVGIMDKTDENMQVRIHSNIQHVELLNIDEVLRF